MSVTIPSGLPASNHAVLRWEWYSLQQGPTTPEFYANCVDIEITSTVAEGGPLPTPRCTMGGWLPIGATGSYRNAYGRGAQFITGPKVASFGAVTPCVTPTTFQCAFNDLTCDCGSSSAATRACPGTTMNPPVGGATAAPSAPPTTLASCAAFSNADCQTHTVNAGDTLSGIVAQAKWTKAPYTVVTVAQVASINGIVDPSSVDVGDTLTIPQVCACDHLYYLPTHMHMHMHMHTHTHVSSLHSLTLSPLSLSVSFSQPGCCDTHTGHPISVFASTKNGGSDGPGSSASSANTDEVDSLKKSIANSSAAIVIFIILFVAALIWAAVASVIAIVMHKKTLNVDERHHEIITAQGGGGVGASVELSSEAAGAGGDAM